MPVELEGLAGTNVLAWRGAKAEFYRQQSKLPPGIPDFTAPITSGRAVVNLAPGEEGIAFVMNGAALLKAVQIADGRTRSVPEIDSITPNQAVVDTGPVTVTIIGFGFTDSTQVIFDGEVVPSGKVKRISQTMLTGIINTDFKDPYQLHRLVVANAGARSPAEVFTILPTTP